ncbi:MAG: cytidylate kinase-like family protein [Bacteroidetes bacterium]|nr:cytidylate kinase-like family protein [Bacteroidota bacterium]
MDNRSSIKIVEEYMERLSERSKSSMQSERNTKPFITISRETGAGGFDFAAKLLDRINCIKPDEKWALFDKNILQKVIEEHNMPGELERFMPEKKIPEFQTVLEQLFGLHPSEHKLIHKISMTIYHLAYIGNIILVGRGANIITAGLKHGLHLRLIEPLEKRVSYAGEYFNIDKVAALKFIETEDKNRREYIKKYYSKNIDDGHLYSIILNFGRVERESAIRALSKLISRMC